MEAQARGEQLKNGLGRAFNQWSADNGGATMGGANNTTAGGGNNGPFGFNASNMSPQSPNQSIGGHSTNNYDNNNNSPDKFDQLDDQEAFDKLEIERVLANDPESLAFFHAQKTRRANITQNGGSLRRLQKNKRFT